ncbi:MAG: HD domain-containing phosphohydrolase [Thiogranum sp.]
MILQANNGRPVLAGLSALFIIMLVGAFLINAYVNKERERDLDDWSVRLSMAAENRVTAIEDWLTTQTGALAELANNASLQLYLWQLSQREEPLTATEPAQLSFLRNLITATAQRYGLASTASKPAVRANLAQRQATGLALVDNQHRLVVATPGMPELDGVFETAVHQALQSATPVISDLALDTQQRVLLAIAVPVQSVLGGQTDGKGGAVVAVFNVQRDLFPLLKHGVPFTNTDESLLVQARGKQVIYLSPTGDDGIPTRKSLPLDRLELAAASAVSMPGQFGRFHNYQGREVLASSQPLRSVPWVLIQAVDAREALLESSRHRRFLITSFTLLLFFIAATLVAAWWHGSSVRAIHDADALRSKTLELQKQSELLHAVTDNTEAYVLLLDERQQVLFANAQMAETAGTAPHELVGNSLAGVIGPANVEPISDSIEQLHKNRGTQHCTRQLHIGGEQRTFQCILVPIEQVGERYRAMLLVLQDITELQRAQQKHATLLRRLVETLMHVVDLHDPHSAHHSSRLVEVANAVGRELKLDEADTRTLDLAASLANLGKIFVPREVLTKTETLTEAEQDLVQRHVQFGIKLLEDLEFDGPVLDTIAQKQEHLDGSGYPNGLKGDDILLTARILSVCNTFVALISPRAYRDAISIEQALNRLLQEAGSKYDRHVIAALFHVVENRSHWSDWQKEWQ